MTSGNIKKFLEASSVLEAFSNFKIILEPSSNYKKFLKTLEAKFCSLQCKHFNLIATNYVFKIISRYYQWLAVECAL